MVCKHEPVFLDCFLLPGLSLHSLLCSGYAFLLEIVLMREAEWAHSMVKWNDEIMHRKAEHFTLAVGLPTCENSRKLCDAFSIGTHLFHLFKEFYEQLRVGRGRITRLAPVDHDQVHGLSVVILPLCSQFLASCATTWSSCSLLDICGCHQDSAAVKKSDDVGVWDLRKVPYSFLEIEGNLGAIDRVCHSLGHVKLDAVATVGKEDKSFLSGLFICFALFLHLGKFVIELSMTQIFVLFNVLLLHSETFEALDELFAVVLEWFEVLHTFKVVESAESWKVLIHD